ELWVGDRAGLFKAMPFRVDGGAMLTRIPWHQAQLLGLPVEVAEAPVEMTEATAAGLQRVQVRRGRLLLRFTETEPDTPFLIPVQYVDAASTAMALLGLGGVIDQMSWHPDGRPATGFPTGYCLLADTR